jgi:hypothetical protein
MRSKAQFFDPSDAGNKGSNSAGGMDACVVCFKYRQKGKMQKNQEKETSTDEVLNTREYKQNPAVGVDVCFLCFLCFFR